MHFYWVLSIEDFSYSSGAKVCQMVEKDISACAKLHLEALGYDREEELLREAHQKGFSTWMVTQNHEIV
jgi:predicted TIM-barrel enzyme